MNARPFSRISVMAVVGATAAAASLPVHAQGPTRDDLLWTFLEQYLVIDDLELHADVVARVYSSDDPDENAAVDGEPIEGSFDFWSRGSMYRHEMYMDPTRYSDVDTVITYNNVHFQLLRRDLRTLGFMDDDQDVFGMGIANPLLEVLQFLYPMDDSNWMHEVKLQAIQADEQDFEDRASQAEWDPQSPMMAPVATFPGATLNGIEYDYRVQFVLQGSRLLPVAVNTVVGGEVWMTLELSDFFTVSLGGGTTYWPGTIEQRVYGDESEILESFNWTIDDFDVSGAFSSDIFTIGSSEFDVAWDADELTVVMAPGDQFSEPWRNVDAPTWRVASSDEEVGRSRVAVVALDGETPSRRISLAAFTLAGGLLIGASVFPWLKTRNSSTTR
jgi:hypothetical protein